MRYHQTMTRNIEVQYLDLVKRVLTRGELKDNRTGVPTYAIAGAMLEHDMNEGFPLLTTKKVSYKNIRVELEGFIKGINSKKWFQERGCKIWDEWCNPLKVPYGKDAETQARMKAEDDLGLIYGVQWRGFNDPRITIQGSLPDGPEICISDGVDQLKNIVDTLKTNPNDRRMICSAWNPLALKEMALPPCHYAFQVTVINGKLNLLWNQRSCDLMLGIPYNIASYATLLHLLAKEAGLKEGRLVGFLADVHIYQNHIEGATEQLTRTPLPLPTIETPNFTSVFDWQYSDTSLNNYQSHPAIKMDVAV